MKNPILLLSVCTALFANWLRADTVVVFNEIMYHPATNEPAMEWVELRNQMAVDVDISGWSLDGGIHYTFASNTIVRGGGFAVIAASPNSLAAATGVTNIFGPFIGRLSNNGDKLQLRNNSGRVMDEVNYGVDGDWPVAPDGSGLSLAKRDRDTASRPAENWTWSEQMGGTPGAENFPQTTGFVAPAGLVSYWNFNEASGLSTLDQAGQNHGTLGSAVARSGSGLGGALSFNGTSNAYVNVGIGNNNNFAVSSGVTIEAVLSPGWSGTNSAVIFKKAPRRPGSYRDTVLTNNPVAYWRLGDSTTTILDTTTNARTGTATAGVLLNQPSLVPSDPANGAVRVGGADRIVVNGFEKIGAAGYSVEFWVKPTTLPASCCQSLVGDGEASGDYFMMNYILGPAQGVTGAIRPHFGPANSPVSMDSITPLQVGNTYHIVTTWDTSLAANNAVIYINGVADRIGTTTRNVPAAGTTGANRVYIGIDDRGTTDGVNTIDEAALYNRPLTAAEVAAHYAAGITTNFDLNLGNAVQLAFQNDGNNSAANPPVAAGPVLSFGLTVGGVYSELDMPLDGTSGRPTLAGLEDGQSHYVAATYNSSSGLKAIYVDGVLRFSTVLSGSVNANNGANAILGNSETNGATPFIGTLDEMTYWSRALSASEVAAHSSAVQAGRDYFTQAGQASLATLAFNEFSASTNAEFWLELVNYGSNDLSLAGYVIQRDGATSNEYIFPAGSLLARGGYLSITNTTLGFHPVSGDKLYLFPPARNKVIDAVVVKNGPRARSPDGTGPWLVPNAPRPGAPNSFAFHNEIVINEIMYHHRDVPGTNGLPVEKSRESWLELYNRSASPVNLDGWELAGGITYKFFNKTLAPNNYLVVAKDAALLRSLFPAADIVGDFNQNLSGSSDTVILNDPSGNPANKVRYFDGGRWPAFASGGGSSLELRDPNSDNSKAEAWAASDESGRSSWQNYSYTMVATIPSGNGQPTVWNEFHLGLLADGECLIDDLTVVESPTTAPVQMVANGDFENGLTGWRVLGTHVRSRVDVEPGNPSNHVLHIIASGPQEHMHNHIEASTIGYRAITSTREYQVSYRAKWLGGNNLLNTRLYFNRSPRTTVLAVPALNGTPGAQNSRYTTNIGPTFSQFQHRPVVPQPGAPVTVSVVAQDPHGVATCEMWWTTNGSSFTSAPMTSQGGGLYSGTIPGYSAGTIVQFYVRAVDGSGVASLYPAGGPNSGALYAVADGQANLSLGHNVRLILTPSNVDLLYANTNVMSNDRLPCTVVYDESRAYYGVGIRFKGSERGRANTDRISFHLEFPPDDPFRGVHPFMLVDRSGAGDSTANKQQEILIKHILLRAGNIPSTQPDMCRVIAPKSGNTGSAILSPRHEDQFVETAYENGNSGTMWELELIYYPNAGQTNQFGYKFVAQPPPNNDSVVGTDISDIGTNKEFYRYNFIIKNHRDADNYSPFITFARTLSLNSPQLDQQTMQVMDVDEWMRVWALVTLCGVGDTYTFGNNHNLFMFSRPSDGKFVAFPVDMDFSFNRAATAALVGDQNISRVINLPANLRTFYGHILDIINTSYNTSYMTYWVSHYRNFAPGQDYSAVISYIQTRANFAITTINNAGGNAPFTVTSTNFVTTSNNLVTLTGTAPVQIKTIKINGVEYPVTWTSISAWTIRAPVSAATNVLNLVGYDVSGNPLTNFTRTVTVNYTGPVVSPEGVVVFNEIMYNPVGAGASFLELFNTSPAVSFDLSNWRVNGLDFTFPPGSIITNRQLLVIAKDLGAYTAAYSNAPPPIGQYDGQLQNEGETLTLFRPGSNSGEEIVVNKVRYEGQAPWPLAPNGQGPSLQLIDATQDNSRVSNWSDGAGWRFASFTGVNSSTRFLMFLGTAGDVYLDDIWLTLGTVPEVGTNLMQNGNFESAFGTNDGGPWIISTNLTGSVISTTVAHSGRGSLHMIGTAAGNSQTTSLYQDTLPIVTNATYTLSFWYLPTTTASNLTMRTGSNFRPVFNINPILFTPGAPNTSAASVPPYLPLWINEVQPENTRGITDNAGDRDPWIELYNAGTNSISLDGYSLADNYTNLTQWMFPTGTVINAGQFLLVWADGEPNESISGQLHTSFRLNRGTGSVALASSPSGPARIIDYLNYQNVGPDRSFGSYPDGQPFDRQIFGVVTPRAANNGAPLVTIFINEWLASNTNSLADPADGNFDDWIELYNPGTNSVDLSGYYLTDTLADTTKWRIPTGTTIAPRGYLLIWADNDTSQNSSNRIDLHANFQLSATGEAIGLFDPFGTMVDAVTFTNQIADISEGRYPDGAASIYKLTRPTPRAANLFSVSTNSAPRFIGISRPSGGQMSLNWQTIAGKSYQVQYKNSLNDATWTPLGTIRIATGDTLSVSDAIGANVQRYYRIVQLD